MSADVETNVEPLPAGEEPDEPLPDPDLPGMWEPADLVGGWADTDGAR